MLNPYEHDTIVSSSTQLSTSPSGESGARPHASLRIRRTRRRQQESAKKTASNSLEFPSDPFFSSLDSTSSQGKSRSVLGRPSEPISSATLFSRLAQRRSQTSLQLRHSGACWLRPEGRFSTPKVVRARTVHLQEGKSLRKFSGDGYGSGKKESRSQPRGRSEEINRIFKTSKLRRRIGFDILLDNYKERMKREFESQRTPSRGTPMKVFAGGRFIGYLNTSERAGRTGLRHCGRKYT